MRLGTIGCGALVVASVIVVDPAGWSPFGPSKWLAISTLGFAGGGAVLWSARASVDRRTAFLWGLLVSLLALSAVVNGDVATAILGHPTRHLGVVTWLLFWLLFSAGQGLDPGAIRSLEAAATIAAGALGAYALWERVLGRPIAIASDTQRLTGPFGSAAFLGAAGCLLAPVALAVAADRDRRTTVRALAATAATLAGVALIGSGTRAAWVGTAVAGSVAVRACMSQRVRTGPRLGARHGSASRHRILVSVTAAAIAAAAAVALSPGIGDLVDRDHGAASRIDEWRVGWRVLSDHPVLGVGPEGYRIAAAEGIDAAYERAYGRDQTLPDRAHSGPIDVAVAGGLPAGIAYAAIIALVLLRASSVLRRGDRARWGLAIGVSAYAVQQLFFFPLAELDPTWWLFAGALLAPSGSTAIDSAPFVAGVEPRRWSLGRRAVAATATVLAVVAIATGTLDVAADRWTRAALTTSAVGRAEEAIVAAERAVDLRPDVSTYRLAAATVHLRRGSLADIDAAIEHAEAALRWSPDDPYVRDQLAVALSRRALASGDEVDTAAALDAWQALVRTDPNRTRWQVQLGRSAVLAGDLDRARAAWLAAAALDPADASIAALLEGLDDDA